MLLSTWYRMFISMWIIMTVGVHPIVRQKEIRRGRRLTPCSVTKNKPPVTTIKRRLLLLPAKIQTVLTMVKIIIAESKLLHLGLYLCFPPTFQLWTNAPETHDERIVKAPLLNVKFVWFVILSIQFNSTYIEYHPRRFLEPKNEGR